MIYRRNEGFRYTFNEPIDCSFKIIKIDHKQISSEFGHGNIIDISPSGLKFITTLDLSPSRKEVEVEIHFSIDGVPFVMPGVIIWQKKGYHNDFSYGVKLEASHEVADQIIEQLKIHARNSLTKKNVHKVEVKTHNS